MLKNRPCTLWVGLGQIPSLRGHARYFSFSLVHSWIIFIRVSISCIFFFSGWIFSFFPEKQRTWGGFVFEEVYLRIHERYIHISLFVCKGS